PKALSNLYFAEPDRLSTAFHEVTSIGSGAHVRGRDDRGRIEKAGARAPALLPLSALRTAPTARLRRSASAVVLSPAIALARRGTGRGVRIAGSRRALPDPHRIVALDGRRPLVAARRIGAGGALPDPHRVVALDRRRPLHIAGRVAAGGAFAD